MAAALSSCMILGSLTVEWKNMKGKKESEIPPIAEEVKPEEGKIEAQ